ncbi:MAG: ABC transporter permease [Actinomycetota bacterium]
MATADSDVIVRSSEPPQLHWRSRLRDLRRFREVLLNIIRKELKVKYTSSVFGAVWSMVNPLVFLGVFWLVFTIVLATPVPNFPVYLLSGLLAWNLYSTSVSSAVRSVIDNANLVKKVYFPREVLPLASIGSALVDFALQGAVLILFMLAFRYPIHPENLVLLPVAIVALLLFTCAMSLLVAAINVHYRDTQHLLALLLLVWFWFTPVVYPSGYVQQETSKRAILGVNLWHIYLLNPLADIMYGFQRALYGVATPLVNGVPKQILVDESVAWILGLLLAVCVGSIGLLYLTWKLFFRMSGDFAEEL